MPSSPQLPELIAVVAMASNRVIGKDGKLPWHLPEDLKFFKRTTLGHPVLMGRRTFESILATLGKPLPGRLNLVVSHTMEPREDATAVRDVAEIAGIPDIQSPVYLIGGAQLYGSLLSQCSELILTYIERPYEGDAFFPAFEHLFDLKEVLGEGDGFEFRRYVRKAG